MDDRGRGGGVERYRVARGEVARMGPVLAVSGAFAAWLVLVLALLPALGLRLPAWVFPSGMALLAMALLVFMNLPGYVDVGSDGVLLDSRGKKRYLPFSELTGARTFRERSIGKTFVGVEVVLASDEVVRIPFGEDLFGASRRAAVLAAAIQRAIETRARGDDDDEIDTALLERGDKSREAWLTSLRNLGHGANAGPRQAPVPTERLWRIVESPGASVSARAGAALALGPNLDEEGKSRLRIASQETAEPHLRIALESAAAGDDEAALGALDVERSTGRSA
jgi:hypothetical protein